MLKKRAYLIGISFKFKEIKFSTLFMNWLFRVKKNIHLFLK
jgi:hypothetical protein